jgi:uncharacterized damage-inducible protein DinB
MTPEQAYTIAQYTLNQLEGEWKTTHRVLSAVPETGTDYKPHDSNMSAQQLAAHIASADLFFLEGVLNGEFKRGDSSEGASITPSQVAAMYAEKMPGLIERLKQMDGDALLRPIQFHSWNMPGIEYIGIALRHSVHHRGQLSVYLRPMGAKVPAIYGGSADEPMTATA